MDSRFIDTGPLASYLRAFSTERDWDQFHTPKNLAMTFSVEAAELLEVFQWLTPEESEAMQSRLLLH